MTQEQKPKATYYYKLFRVKRKDGRVTTVSMNIGLVTQACRTIGNLDLVGKIVRAAALEYEDGTYKNCSGFVANQLKAEVLKKKQSASQMAAC